jgi:hypothetical protein
MGFRWKLIAAFVALFLIGGVCGSILTMSLAPVGRHPKPPKFFKETMIQHVAKRLSLTPEQTHEFRTQAEKTFDQVDTIRKDAVLKGDRLIDDALGKFGATLNPEQQASMDIIRAERRKRLEHMLHPH